MIVLHATNALQDSMKSHKIKQAINFPLSLIIQLRPSLKNKFIMTKEKTREQSLHHGDDIGPINFKKRAIIIESNSEDTMNSVQEITRYIHHHSSVKLHSEISNNF